MSFDIKSSKRILPGLAVAALVAVLLPSQVISAQGTDDKNSRDSKKSQPREQSTWHRAGSDQPRQNKSAEPQPVAGWHGYTGNNNDKGQKSSNRSQSPNVEILPNNGGVKVHHPGYLGSDEVRKDNPAPRVDGFFNSTKRDPGSQSERNNDQQRNHATDNNWRPQQPPRDTFKPAPAPGFYQHDKANGPSARPEPGRDNSGRSNNPPAMAIPKHNTPERGAYRKDYANIGQSWNNRWEQKDRNWNAHWNNWRTHRDSASVKAWFPSFRFGAYSFDYVPEHSRPSIYCFYYDYFPPYIFDDRVFYRTGVVDNQRIVDFPLYANADTYYLADSHSRVENALRNIQRAWEDRDVDAFFRGVAPNAQIGVFIKNEYVYSVDRSDYYDMTRDAMDTIKTRSFDFYLARQRGNDTVWAYARHTYLDRDGNLETVYVSYTLQRISGSWYIIETGCSPERYD